MKNLKVSIIGTAVISTFGSMTAVQAESNPFAVTELSEGYMQLAAFVGGKPTAPAIEEKTATPAPASTTKKVDGACGEGKCGEMMKGDKMKKGMESTCGEMMKGKEGKCGMKKKCDHKKSKKAQEGKCGEGKCGEMMKNGKMKKGLEGACGDMMKGKEGACGMEKKPVEKK